VQTKVKPNQTQVYVDGYYAGIVDDFDGTFQKLYLPPGEHEIELRLDGHRGHRQSLMVNSGTNYKIHHQMEPLAPGETAPPAPEPSRPERYEESERAQPPPVERREPPPREERYRREEPRVPPKEDVVPRDDRRPAPPTSGSFGMLTLRVQPGDANVIIDGELWGSLEGFEQMAIHLPAGRHRIEIRRPGFQPFVTEVDIRPGEATPLNVKLNGDKKDGNGAQV
jgi:hypothetical protein